MTSFQMANITPTPEDLRKFKDFSIEFARLQGNPDADDLFDYMSESDTVILWQSYEAYLKHRLNEQDTDIVRKMEIHVETTMECLDNFGLPQYVEDLLKQDIELIKLAINELCKVPVLQEEVKLLRESLASMTSNRVIEVDALQQQLSEANATIDEAKKMLPTDVAEIISDIVIDKANLEYIGETGKINGTLLSSLIDSISKPLLHKNLIVQWNESNIKKLKAEIERLKGLLQELVDLQNGAPLEQHRKEWEETMDKCYKLLRS